MLRPAQEPETRNEITKTKPPNEPQCITRNNQLVLRAGASLTLFDIQSFVLRKCLIKHGFCEVWSMVEIDLLPRENKRKGNAGSYNENRMPVSFTEKNIILIENRLVYSSIGWRRNFHSAANVVCKLFLVEHHLLLNVLNVSEQHLESSWMETLSWKCCWVRIISTWVRIVHGYETSGYETSMGTKRPWVRNVWVRNVHWCESSGYETSMATKRLDTRRSALTTAPSLLRKLN